MSYLKWIAAAALVGSATACVDNAPYGGGSGYGYAPTSVGYAQPTYYQAQPTYSGYQRPQVNNYYVAPQSQPRVVEQTRYVPVPVATPQRAQDRNHDGVADRNQVDRNHDGVPDNRERN